MKKNDEKVGIRVQALLAYSNEHYAHARDHEHLRSQITSIISAGSFILIGLGLERNLNSPVFLLLVGCLVCVLGALNLRLNSLHSNRFKAHVSAAQEALKGVEAYGSNEGEDFPTIESCRAVYDGIKEGRLSVTWNLLPILVIAIGVCCVIGGAVSF